MRIDVNGVRIFFDVEGAKLVPDGPIMREKPTLILLHGGPGMDHAHLKPAFSQFADTCQVIYIDHRGNGRSERGEASTWRLSQWGDDLFAFCEALEIEKPIVLGTSFGGIVAIAYATRHPEHPGKLILASTQATFNAAASLAVFERLGGAAARDAADGFFAKGDAASLERYARICLPLYTRRHPADAEAMGRCIPNPAVLEHYFGAEGEAFKVDLRPDLSRIACPTLVLVGDDDPITPVESSAEIAAAISSNLVQFVRYPDTGHTILDDEPRSFADIRRFMLS